MPSIPDIQNIQDNPDRDRIDFFLTNGCYMIFKVIGSVVLTQVVAQLGEEI